MNDLTLLRRYEPVVCFTHGEMFFPCAVDGYLRRCSLWLRDNRGRERELVAEGNLSAAKLAEFSQIPADHTMYLHFTERPLDPLEYQHWLSQPHQPVFHAPGRLARVGLFARILDSLFNLSLLLRGTVPGGTAAAAQIKYADMRQEDPRYVYYGRVIREGGYIVLHYLFFFPMNDWRSSFYGVNDHEADWEQVFVYLSDEAGNEPSARWVAYASHDFTGDDLRRRWDDPNLRKFEQNHPIIFAGAGSHASYFEPGEYKMSVEPKFLGPVKRGAILLRKFWVENLGQGDVEHVNEEVGALLSVPFIDYARGDGVAIGPGQQRQWTPIILTEEMGWVENYRGLWGLDTQDPLGGERAPAGPKFNRAGAVRRAWYDPLGWAGLDKITPPGATPAQLAQHIATLAEARRQLQQELNQRREEVRLLALEVQALQETDYLNHIYKQQTEKLEQAQAELQLLYARYTQTTETWQACRAYLTKIEQGNWGDPQAHLRHKHRPEPPLGKQARIAELWAAVSGGLLILALALLLMLRPAGWLTWIVLVGLIFLAIESTLRGRLPNFLLNLTLILAGVTGVVLLVEFWWLVFILAFLGLAVSTITTNLRELWSD